MKKICIFNESISRSGGIERVTVNLANMWMKQGYDVEVITLDNCITPFYDLDAYVNVRTLDLNVKDESQNRVYIFGMAIWRLRKIIKQEKYDFLISIWTSRALIGILSTIGTMTKVIACEHIAYEKANFPFYMLRYILYPFADAIISLTQRDMLKYKKLNNNSYVVENYLDDDFFLEVNKDRSKIVLSVGRQTEQKGFDLLLRAWYEIYSKYPEWKLVIVGDDTIDVKYAKYIKKQRCELNLEKSVVIMPAQKNMLDLYRKASIYTMASRYEGLPLVLVEAMATGLPVISFDCPTGPKEIIINDNIGVLVENGNIEELSNAIEKLILDENKRLELAINSRKSAIGKYSRKVIADKWEVVFSIIK